VSCGDVLPSGVGAADALRCGAVLRGRGAVAGERAVRRRVLLRECWGLERAAGRECGRVRAVSCWAVLSCGDSGAVAVSQGEFLGGGGQQECVRLRGVRSWALLSLHGHDEREHLRVQCWLLLSGGHVRGISGELWLSERFLLSRGECSRVAVPACTVSRCWIVIKLRMVHCWILLRRDCKSHKSVCSMPCGTLLRCGCLVPHCLPAGLVCTIARIEELFGLPYRLHVSSARYSRACTLSSRILLHGKQLRSSAMPSGNIW
jgi:hypothetical protein